MVEIDERVAFAREFLNGPVLRDDISRKPPTELDYQRMAASLQEAADDPDTNDFDVLTMLAADAIRKNQRLPDWLATFAADVLEGKKKRPTKRGPDKYDNWGRNYALCRAAEEVAKRYNLPIYYYRKHDFYDEESCLNNTAAGIVSQAANCGIEVAVKACRTHKKYTSMGDN